MKTSGSTRIRELSRWCLSECSCWNCRRRRNSRIRLLLIIDTHGRLGVINELAVRTQADAVIHAGDFGFHDDSSFQRLSERDIGLQISHSDLPRDEKARLVALPCPGRIAAARDARLLGDFHAA